MSILLLFVIDVCMESNKINLKLLNLGQINQKWLLSFNEPLQVGQLVLSDKQSYLPRQSGYNLRNENNTFHPPFSRTSSFYNSFIPFTIRLWNTLPLTITESPSLNTYYIAIF
jgi:hypothetical protein